jgi:hypothetical protein
MAKPLEQAIRVDARDRAARRLRVLTINAAGLALGVAGMIAAFVGSKAHAVASAQTTNGARVTRTTAGVPLVPAPTATVSSGSSAAGVQAAQSSAPAASGGTPVAVSGGS